MLWLFLFASIISAVTADALLGNISTPGVHANRLVHSATSRRSNSIAVLSSAADAASTADAASSATTNGLPNNASMQGGHFKLMMRTAKARVSRYAALFSAERGLKATASNSQVSLSEELATSTNRPPDQPPDLHTSGKILTATKEIGNGGTSTNLSAGANGSISTNLFAGAYDRKTIFTVLIVSGVLAIMICLSAMAMLIYRPLGNDPSLNHSSHDQHCDLPSPTI